MDSGHEVFRTRGIYLHLVLQYVRRDTGKEGSGWEGCGNRSFNLFLFIYMSIIPKIEANIRTNKQFADPSKGAPK